MVNTRWNKVIYDTPYGLKYPITKDFIEYVKVLQEENRNNLTKALKTFSDSEWVDVRDRLPSEDEVKEHHKYFYVTVKCEYVLSGIATDIYSYDIETEKWYNRQNYNCTEEVIAWKTLPKPYKRKE